MPSVFEQIEEKLTGDLIPFAVSRHEPVFTSEQAAAIRGVPLASGAKALIVKAGDRFVLLVIPANRKLDSKKTRTSLGVKGIRFATVDEVLQLTGLQPGSIPPFGSLFGLPTFVDPALEQNDSINFNAGDHGISIQMSRADFMTVECPIQVDLT